MSNTSSSPDGTTSELPPSIVADATENAANPDFATQEFGGSGTYDDSDSGIAGNVAEDQDSRSNRRDPAVLLLGLTQGYDLFQSNDGTAFATIDIGGRFETLPLVSPELKQRLLYEYYCRERKTPPADAIAKCISILGAKANYGGSRYSVHVRVARQGNQVFLDLANRDRQVVEIAADGWQIVGNSPIRFLRPNGMEPLPLPQRGGSIELLRPFLNLVDHNDFVLVVAYLLGTLYPPGPYPVLAVSGPHGSAKSSFSRILRNLIDPNISALRDIPQNRRDFHIMAKNAHVIALDNISRLPEWVSDILCRLSTGAGFSTRKLRTNDGESLFTATRPSILNGIEEIVSRPDLADRSIFLTLERLLEPRPEQELREAFERDRPLILGALLDGVAHGLCRLPEVRMNQYPRLADFARFATACEEAFWEPESFSRAHSANQERTLGAMVEANPVAGAVSNFMSAREKWRGTATQLAELFSKEGSSMVNDREWPKSARELSGRLTRLQPILYELGIEMTRDRAGHTGQRLITITKRK